MNKKIIAILALSYLGTVVFSTYNYFHTVAVLECKSVLDSLIPIKLKTDTFISSFPIRGVFSSRKGSHRTLWQLCSIGHI